MCSFLHVKQHLTRLYLFASTFFILRNTRTSMGKLVNIFACACVIHVLAQLSLPIREWETLYVCVCVCVCVCDTHREGDANTLRGTSKPLLGIFYNISETINRNYLIFGRNYYQTFSNILLKFYCENLTETRKNIPR